MIDSIETKQQFNLYMFLISAQQCEGWAYALKGTLTHQAKFKLNNYITHSNALFHYLKDVMDYDDLVDNAEWWSDFNLLLKEGDMETKKRLLSILKQVVKESKENNSLIIKT